MKKENLNKQLKVCHPELDSGSHINMTETQRLFAGAHPSFLGTAFGVAYRPRIKSGMTEESGRSMVEMLGVLAIIGVLSVMGIAGYKAAMTRHRANELLNEASKRAVVVAGQITLHGHNPSLSEFNEKDFSGGSFETTVYGSSGDAEWTNIGATPDKQFTLSITGVEGAICEQMQGIAADNAIIKDFTPNSCDSDNPNTVKLTYNNDLSTDTIPSGDNNTGNAPTTPSTCVANNMYWCVNSQTCVANQAACLALCPEDRKCGSICCAKWRVCDPELHVCVDQDENVCPDGSVGVDANGNCCEVGEIIISDYDFISFIEEKCCPEGSVSATPQGHNCCTAEEIMVVNPDTGEGQCCQAGSNCCGEGNMVINLPPLYGVCCPEGSGNYTHQDGCCDVNTIIVQDEGGYKHCCPTGSVGYKNGSCF